MVQLGIYVTSLLPITLLTILKGKCWLETFRLVGTATEMVSSGRTGLSSDSASPSGGYAAAAPVTVSGVLDRGCRP